MLSVSIRVNRQLADKTFRQPRGYARIFTPRRDNTEDGIAGTFIDTFANEHYSQWRDVVVGPVPAVMLYFYAFDRCSKPGEKLCVSRRGFAAVVLGQDSPDETTFSSVRLCDVAGRETCRIDLRVKFKKLPSPRLPEFRTVRSLALVESTTAHLEEADREAIRSYNDRVARFFSLAKQTTMLDGSNHKWKRSHVRFPVGDLPQWFLLTDVMSATMDENVAINLVMHALFRMGKTVSDLDEMNSVDTVAILSECMITISTAMSYRTDHCNTCSVDQWTDPLSGPVPSLEGADCEDVASINLRVWYAIQNLSINSSTSHKVLRFLHNAQLHVMDRYLPAVLVCLLRLENGSKCWHAVAALFERSYFLEHGPSNVTNTVVRNRRNDRMGVGEKSTAETRRNFPNVLVEGTAWIESVWKGSSTRRDDIQFCDPRGLRSMADEAMMQCRTPASDVLFPLSMGKKIQYETLMTANVPEFIHRMSDEERKMVGDPRFEATSPYYNHHYADVVFYDTTSDPEDHPIGVDLLSFLSVQGEEKNSSDSMTLSWKPVLSEGVPPAVLAAMERRRLQMPPAQTLTLTGTSKPITHKDLELKLSSCLYITRPLNAVQHHRIPCPSKTVTTRWDEGKDESTAKPEPESIDQPSTCRDCVCHCKVRGKRILHRDITDRLSVAYVFCQD